MQLSGKKEEVFLIKGKCNVEVIGGSIESIGAYIGAGEQFVIPLGKTIPVEFLEDAELNVSGKDGIRKLDKSTIPTSWHNLIEIIKTGKMKNIIVLGEVDTGKSFFATYISNKLYSAGYSVGVIDCDIGQSDVGAPGTMGLTYITKPTLFLPSSPVAEMYFVGAHSANLHFLPSLVGFNFLLRKSDEQADITIVNTSGWVQGDGGRAYKRAKMEIMNPDIIVLLQRGNELEHLVKIYEPSRIFRISVSTKATMTPPSERKSLRELVMAQYFKGAKEIELDFDKIETERVFFKTGTEITPPFSKILYAEKLSGWEGALFVAKDDLTSDDLSKLHKEFGKIMIVNPAELRNLYVALTDKEHHFLGLGTITDIDFANRRIKLYSTAKADNIKIIQFGSLKIKADGSEAGFIEPGSF